MHSDSLEFAHLWYVVAHDVAQRPSRWQDENEAEEWLASIGVSSGRVLMHEPGSSFMMFAPRDAIAALSAALATYAESHSVGSEDYRNLAETIAMDLGIMHAPSDSARFLGVHPWSFSQSPVWEFWGLRREQALTLAETLREDPQLSGPLMGCYDDYQLLSGDPYTARMILDVLDEQEGADDLLQMRLTLGRWVECIERRQRVAPPRQER